MAKHDAPRMVLITCASLAEATRIARSAVEKRLAACGNILTAPVRSIYRWQGRVESAKECLLILKSKKSALARLEAEVKRLHSYDVPEFIALDVASGSRDYLSWLKGNID
jgi:periplasmic divalent cation tolerance protein